MEPKGSLPCSQQPGTVPCPEPDASSPHCPTLFPKIHSNIIHPSTTIGLASGLFPSSLQTKIL